MPTSSGWRLLGWPFCPLLPLPVPLTACTGNSTLVYWLILASCRLSELCGCRWLPPGPYPLLPPLRLLHRTPLHLFRILGHQIRKFYRIFRIRPPPPQKRTRSLPFTFWTPPCLLHQQLPLQTPPDPIRIHRSFFRIRVLLLRIQHLSLQLLLFTLRDNPCLPRWAGRTSPPSHPPTTPLRPTLPALAACRVWCGHSTLLPSLFFLLQLLPLSLQLPFQLPLHPLLLPRTRTPPLLRRLRTGGTGWPSRPSSLSASSTRGRRPLAATISDASSAEPLSWPLRPKTGQLSRLPGSVFALLTLQWPPGRPSGPILPF